MQATSRDEFIYVNTQDRDKESKKQRPTQGERKQRRLFFIASRHDLWLSYGLIFLKH